MNERIRELAKAYLVHERYTRYGEIVEEDLYEFYPDELEEFAELIVQETLMQMAIQMDKFGDDQANNPAWYKSEEVVKKHFGVKE